MSRARGRAAPPAPARGTVDLAAIQELIAEQLQEAQVELRDLDAKRERAQARIWALRGKLELTMELSQQVSAPTPDGPAGQAARDGATVTEGVEE